MFKSSAGPGRTIVWMTAVVVGLLVPAGLYALARGNPGSPPAAIDAAAIDAAATGDRAGASVPPAVADGTMPTAGSAAIGAGRGRHAGCGECGVVVSVRRVVRRAGGDVRHDGGARAGWPEATTVARTEVAQREPAARAGEYEITVRFRDGSTTVLTELGLPTWRAGSRAIVIHGVSVARR